VWAYCEREGVTGALALALETAVAAMDAAFLRHCSKK
jgi:hypothetical protein